MTLDQVCTRIGDIIFHNISPCFKPGVKFMVIAIDPEKPDQDFAIGNIDDAELEAFTKRHVLRAAKELPSITKENV